MLVCFLKTLFFSLYVIVSYRAGFKVAVYYVNYMFQNTVFIKWKANLWGISNKPKAFQYYAI